MPKGLGYGQKGVRKAGAVNLPKKSRRGPSPRVSIGKRIKRGK